MPIVHVRLPPHTIKRLDNSLVLFPMKGSHTCNKQSHNRKTNLRDPNNLRKYYSALSPNLDSQLLLHFAFNCTVIVIKIFRLGAMSFGLAPRYCSAHLCFIMIIISYYLLLGHDRVPTCLDICLLLLASHADLEGFWTSYSISCEYQWYLLEKEAREL